MKNIKNNARVATKDQSKREKMDLIRLAIMNGIKINEELMNLYNKELILESDYIYFVNGELMTPGFNQDNPVPSYNGNGVETEITSYNELKTALIKENKDGFNVIDLRYKGVLITCYYLDDDCDFSVEYVLLGDTDITELVDLDEVFYELQNDII